MTVGVAVWFKGRLGLFQATDAAGSLLQAEVVTADGVVRIANACTNRTVLGLKRRRGSLGSLPASLAGACSPDSFGR